MACSNKALIFFVVPLLMALLAASVSVEVCGLDPNCDPKQCEELCRGYLGGTCKLIGGAYPSCCCSEGSSASTGVNELSSLIRV
ncbi:unnamed protein product [Urochloa decumbens]|uniref:Uncharacterized protein n=1 Tax=Urochloa decumbens TaxID=240449 RepID=A0ABC9C323_9POAL